MKNINDGYTYLYTIEEPEKVPVKLIANKLRNVFHITILSEPDVKPFKLCFDNGDWIANGNLCVKARRFIPEIRKAVELFRSKSLHQAID